MRRKNPAISGFCLVLLLGSILGPSSVFAGPKTDVFLLRNGNDVICEIKGMGHGKLKASTSDMGTLSVEWDKVVRLTSPSYFLITLHSGEQKFGRLPDSGEDGVLTVANQLGTNSLVMDEIATIEPIKSNFWDRVDISLSAGFNWTKASETSTTNFSSYFDYIGRVYRLGVGANGSATTERDNRTTRRFESLLYGSRLISGRLQGRLAAGASRNDQLGLDLRTSLDMTLGYNLLMERHLELLVSAGLVGNREWAAEEEPPTNSGEAILSVLFTLFRYDSPKTDLNFSAALFPSLTVKDRVRFDMAIALRKELVTDLFLELQYYLNTDNRPSAGAESTSDRGIVFGLGWSK